MKNIFKSITALLLFFGVCQINAQTNVIDFTLNSENINISGQNFAITSTITKTENSLVWTQYANNNTDATNFTITGTTGNWDQATSSGLLTYSLIIDNYSADLTLSGQETGLTATLMLNATADSVESYTFNIDTITYQ